MGLDEGEEADDVRCGGGHVRGGEAAEEVVEDGGGEGNGRVAGQGSVKEGERGDRVL